MMEVVLEVSLWNKVEDNRYQNYNVVFLCQYFAFAPIVLEVRRKR